MTIINNKYLNSVADLISLTPLLIILYHFFNIIIQFFTNQYADMQKLWDNYKDKGLLVLGVPSNSFNQEKNEDSEVKKFCEVNFNINFPLTSITSVKGDDAHEIYKWARENHGKSAIPKWNFHKILIDKDGKIAETYSSFTNPMSKKVISKIETLLEN